MIPVKENKFLYDDVEITYHTCGSGKPLFLIPAFHADLERMEPLISVLADYFFVIVPDLPGIGNTQTMGKYEHTIGNYAKILAKLVENLALENYVLSGISYGGAILIRMLENNVRQPSHIILLEALFDFDYVMLKSIYKWLYKFFLLFNKKDQLLLGNFFLHSKLFLSLFFYLTLKHSGSTKDMLKNQLRVTMAVNVNAWVENLNDIARLHLKDEQLSFDIPMTMIFNEDDKLINAPATIKELEKVFPSSKLLTVKFEGHSPATAVDRSFIDDVIAPLIPELKNISEK